MKPEGRDGPDAADQAAATTTTSSSDRIGGDAVGGSSSTLPTTTANATHRNTATSPFSSLLTASAAALDDENDRGLQAALVMSLQPSAQGDDESSPPNHQNAGETVIPTMDDDEDAALQAALAMSMEVNTTTTTITITTTEEPSTGDDHDAAIPSSADLQSQQQDPFEMKQPSSVSDSSLSAPPFFNVSGFHEIMWSTQLTTDNDKRRWVSQGIDVARANAAKKMQIDTTIASSRHSIANDTAVMMASNFGPWGLMQAHGGPCGVLAAVQAELLRLLLFGRTNTNDTTDLDYPMLLTDDDTHATEVPASSSRVATDGEPPVSEALVLRALAMAIAMIVARAALMPSAAHDSTSGGAIRMSSGDGAAVGREDEASIVLPVGSSSTLSSYEGLSWQELEPWTKLPAATTTDAAAAAANISNNNTKRSGFTLQVFKVASTSAANPVYKRQKMDGADSPQNQNVSRDDRIVRLAKAISGFLLESSRLDYYRKPGGVLLLVMSLVCSRGESVLTDEMDDPMGTKLTSQFGHCSQELINLLLTGQAVSNVFDNTLTPSGELTCRGIQIRPAIGYLSQLEAMRYCEVGGYYKNPRFPIWVVGSTSHFTVLFGEAAAIKESQSDALLEKCRRAFKTVEGGEENGFIAKNSLGKAIESLGIDLGGENALQALAAMLEVSGAGIILWDDFWKAASRLLTGASVENVLNGTAISTVDTTSAKDTPQDDASPLLLTQFGESSSNQGVPLAFDQKLPAKPPAAAETDEEMAQRLAAEWGSDSNEAAVPQTSPISSPAAAARPASPMEIERAAGPMSDEEYARQLQSQWDTEVIGGGNSVAAVDGSPPRHDKNEVIVFHDEDEMYDLPALVPAGQKDPNPADDGTVGRPAADFESFGDSIQLYHYNGLRGGTLTPFRVTRLSAEEAVGASIALTQQSTGGALMQSGAGGLEDIIRTKYPSAMINWFGKLPPNID